MTLLLLSAIAAEAAAGTPLGQSWHADYQAAWEQANREQKMLLVFFRAAGRDRAARAFERKTLADPEVEQKLGNYVLARLPLDAEVTIGGQTTRLLSHPAFSEMLGRQGVAIVDLAHAEPHLHGQVVTAYPFAPGRYCPPHRMALLLDLPPGTLTQRTIIFAVRAHPERPESTTGDLSPVLAVEAQRHSDYQASIGNQGHHHWESRFHQINARLPGGMLAQEVVAESWPGQSLIEAAEDCVHCWRQSPGHWQAVRGRHRLFGYDMKRGANGVWYATGIFGIFNR